jgi:hypothetical protein
MVRARNQRGLRVHVRTCTWLAGRGSPQALGPTALGTRLTPTMGGTRTTADHNVAASSSDRFSDACRPAQGWWRRPVVWEANHCLLSGTAEPCPPAGRRLDHWTVGAVAGGVEIYMHPVVLGHLMT